MNEKQANIIISLLESIDSKLSNIESNTSALNDMTSEYGILDEIKYVIKGMSERDN